MMKAKECGNYLVPKSFFNKVIKIIIIIGICLLRNTNGAIFFSMFGFPIMYNMFDSNNLGNACEK